MRPQLLGVPSTPSASDSSTGMVTRSTAIRDTGCSRHRSMQRTDGVGALPRWCGVEPGSVCRCPIRRRRPDVEGPPLRGVLRHQGPVHDRLVLRPVDDRRTAPRLLRRPVPGLRLRDRLANGHPGRRQTLPPIRDPQAHGFPRHEDSRQRRRRHDHSEEPAAHPPAQSHDHDARRLGASRQPTSEPKHVPGHLAYRPAIRLDQVIFEPHLIQVPRPPARPVELAFGRRRLAQLDALLQYR